MALTLLRHAPLELKYHKRYNGWSDLDIDIDLIDSRKIEPLKDSSFDLIYSSDLRRCSKTLKVIGVEDYILDRRLREVRFKSFVEGKSFEELRELPNYSDEFLSTQESWHRFICDESIEDFYRRIEEFLAELPRSQEILICSHAGTLRAICKILGAKEVSLDYLEFIRIEL